MTPNALFLLFMAGILAVYVADLCPMSRIIRFGGIGAIVAAVYLAPSYPIRLTGLLCLFAAAGLFAIDFWSNINYLAASVAAILLPVGFRFLYSGSQRIDAQLAIWLGFMLSLATAAYCWQAKRARLNKLADL